MNDASNTSSTVVSHVSNDEEKQAVRHSNMVDHHVEENKYESLTWDSDDDPGNPHNWTLRKSSVNALVVIFLGFLS